jgi:hypothetical protein
MPTERDWADGFLVQAQADLEAAHVLVTQVSITVASASVFSMLLQMAFEKFAKAALLRSGSMSYSDAKSSHKGASRMVAAMRVQKKLMAPIGGPHVWTAAFEVVEALERAQPSLAKAHQGPQLEYPWESSNGTVLWPAKDLPIASRLANPSSRLVFHVLDFAEKLKLQFNAIFP